MLEIVVPEREMWDPVKEEFFMIKEQPLMLEHSLISLSKWESKWHKNFIGNDKKTPEEIRDYIRCMTLNKPNDDTVYLGLTEKNISDIADYITDSATATWFSDHKKMSSKRQKEVITSELIYYAMISYNIPHEFEKWHLNRLLTLIRICEEKNNPKKMSKKEILNNNKLLNAKRRAAMRSKG